MTEKQLPDVITQLSIRSVVDALQAELPTMTPGGICLLAAHIHLETGMRACHCWNLGNAKYTTGCGRDWTMFACGEEVESTLAAKLRAESPALIEFVGAPYSRNGHAYQSIKIKPPHPWSRFRAFGTLREGVADHIAVLHQPNMIGAWTALRDGLPGSYSEGLRKGDYFTADPGVYARTLRDRLLLVRGTLLDKPRLSPGGKPLPDAVRECQRLIGIPETGNYDHATVEEVKVWQAAHGLTDDGKFWERSWATALCGAEALP